VNGPSALLVIPARGDSRGIPRKNARPFLGRPLIAWTIDAARDSGVAARILLSTEDEEIAELARAEGAEVVERPAELARDETPTAPVVKHALERSGAQGGLVLVLEPTSPGRRPEHVREAVELLASSEADSVASVCEVPHHQVAEKQLRLGEDGLLSGLDGGHIRSMTHRRQDLPVRYAFDGLIFGCRTELIRRDDPTLWGEQVAGLRVHHRYSIDLDRPEDWAPAEARMRELLAEESG